MTKHQCEQPLTLGSSLYMIHNTRDSLSRVVGAIATRRTLFHEWNTMPVHLRLSNFPPNFTTLEAVYVGCLFLTKQSKCHKSNGASRYYVTSKVDPWNQSFFYLRVLGYGTPIIFDVMTNYDQIIALLMDGVSLSGGLKSWNSTR